jgi:hypothetical protein
MRFKAVQRQRGRPLQRAATGPGTLKVAETTEKTKNDASNWKSGSSGELKRENSRRSALSAPALSQSEGRSAVK